MNQKPWRDRNDPRTVFVASLAILVIGGTAGVDAIAAGGAVRWFGVVWLVGSLVQTLVAARRLVIYRRSRSNQ